MPLHLRRSNGDLQEQTREARRFLMETVRNDWTFPQAPHILPFDYPTSPSTAPLTSRPSTTDATTTTPSTSTADAPTQVRSYMDTQPISPPSPRSDLEPRDWRERTYSSYESSGTEDNNTTNTPAPAPTAPTYKFDTPDSVSTSLAERKAIQKRKRQQRLDEEMNWNIGLAHWNAQRNAWTGAQQRTLPLRPAAPAPTTPRTSSTSSRSKSVTSPISPRPKSTTSTTSTPTTPITSTPPPTHQTTSIPSPTTPATTTTGTEQEPTLLIPVTKTILPNHPVRSKITTSTYTDIYTKIILQGRTPSIPINLSDVTRALVHGWKEEGQWPPRIAPVEPSLVSKKNKKAGNDNVGGGGAGGGGGGKGNGTGNGGNKLHLSKGVQAVGRVLGFGGPKVPVENGKGQGSGPGPM